MFVAKGRVRADGEQFLSEQLPRLHLITDGWLASEHEWRVSGPFPPVGPERMLGSVLELAVTFDLAPAVPYADEVRAASIAYGVDLRHAFGHRWSTEGQRWFNTTTSSRQLSTDEVGALVYLAAWRKWIHCGEQFVQLEVDNSADAVTEVFPQLWDTYQRHGRGALEELGQVRDCQIPLSEGCLFADLIAGTAVVDIKSHRYPDTWSLGEALEQVVIYALADLDDQYGLDQVAVYLGWHGATLSVTLNEIMAANNRSLHEWPHLRERFWTATAAARAKTKYWSSQHRST